MWAAGPRNGRPTPWDAWAGESERVPLSRKQDGVRVPDFDVVESIMEPYNLLEDLLTAGHGGYGTCKVTYEPPF